MNTDERDLDNIISSADMPPPPPESDLDLINLPTNEMPEMGKHKREADGDVPSYHSIDHRERITWKAAPSRILIRPIEERHRISNDMDLLTFQTGADASSEEEEDYLDIDLDRKLVDGVKLELSEDRDLKTEVYTADRST